MAKYRIKEAVSVALGPSPEVSFKAGEIEPKQDQVPALEHLVSLGLAERVKTAKEE